MSSLKNLRVYAADHSSDPSEVAPPPSLRRYWTRKAIAEWLVDRLSETPLTLVGIDHGFSFPLQYFERYGLPHDWPVFLNDFQEYWPTDQENTYADFVREGICGNAAARAGNLCSAPAAGARNSRPRPDGPGRLPRSRSRPARPSAA